MVLKLSTESLDGLCTKDQLDLMNAVDRLRLQGIDHYISLPQIIVCGDQSSGKSSVLEAISGVPFPVKSNLCTCFPTEVVLRRADTTSVTVSIVPHDSLGQSEEDRLSGFQEKLNSFEGLPSLVEKAKAVMDISKHGKSFSKDILRVEITGPDRPQLTIVDLPGLIHSVTKKQTAADVDLVQELVDTYMKQPRSIILAVVSAKNDFANQVILKSARAADQSGDRTLGIITKPDTLVTGSGSEAQYVELATNKQVDLKLGWHVLKNLDSEREKKGTMLLHRRNTEEADFFSKGVWADLPRHMLGVGELRGRLSKLLLQQIATELPSLIKEIDVRLESCRQQLRDLGEPRATVDAQRQQLIQSSERYQALVHTSVDGTYNGAFFQNAQTDTGEKQRLRAVVQKLNQEFSDELVKNGHRRDIQDDVPKPLDSFLLSLSNKPIPITRDSFVAHVEELMKRTRGRELPGIFSSMLVKDLFHEQSELWEPIVRHHVTRVWEAVNTFLRLAVEQVSEAGVSQALLSKIFEPAMKSLLAAANTKAAELMHSHRQVHPITYDQEYAIAVRKITEERRKTNFTKIMQDFFPGQSLSQVHLGNNNGYGGNKDLTPLIRNLAKSEEVELSRRAASEALNCMEAYYKIALKRFVDDVAVEAIEKVLLGAIADMLSPVAVFQMPADLVSALAGESADSQQRRAQLTKQIDVLDKGSETCKRFVGVRLGDQLSSLSIQEDGDDKPGNEE